jgi:hypothetical protein
MADAELISRQRKRTGDCGKKKTLFMLPGAAGKNEEGSVSSGRS